MILKKLLPPAVKLKIKILFREIKAFKYNHARVFTDSSTYTFAITTTQEIKKGTYFENKFHNISTAAQKIDSIVLETNQVLSFWKLVGNPNNPADFKIGRNIKNGVLSEEIAGGICQLSSIIYLNALKADLKIIERHNHSVDIYAENERFTPLGADATVVYGNKDLIIKNHLPFPIKFKFKLSDNFLSCSLESMEEIMEKEVLFERNYTPNQVVVTTLINKLPKYHSEYQLPK